MGVPLSPQQRNMLVSQGDIVADAQGVLMDDMPNSEQAADLARMATQVPGAPEDLQ
jgi:hypothetical protein